MIVFLESEFERGDVVTHKSNNELRFVVTGFLVTSIRNDKAEDYLLECSDGYEKKYLQPTEVTKDAGGT